MAVSTFANPIQPIRLEKRPTALRVLDPFLAVSAIGGGLGLLTNVIDLPREWLDNTPFNSYAVPGIALLFVVGGAWLFATWALFTRNPSAPLASIGAGVIQLGWFAVQVAFLGYISWMQPLVGTLAVFVIVLSWRWQKSLAKRTSDG
jgi:hypothetical protein